MENIYSIFYITYIGLNMSYFEIVLTFMIFVIILLFYIHIQNHYKTSFTMEIYEYSYTSNAHLQEICDLKQPILFQISQSIPELFQDVSTTFFSQFSNTELNVKDIDDYWKTPTPSSVDSITLSMESFFKLSSCDLNKQYFTENNHDFIIQHPHIESIHTYLQPHFTYYPTLDFITGSYNAITPLRFHKNYRLFFIVISGSLKVKMIPYKHNKNLNCVMDYEHMEYWSPINSFDVSNTAFQFLEFEVFAGYTLYIPPYWFYSMKFSNEIEQNIAITVNYNSPMNVLANIYDHGKNIIQKYNTYYKPLPSSSPIVQSDTL